MMAWARAGVYLGHFTDSQQAQTTPVALSELRPGDLVFYHNPGDGPENGNPYYHHVALYVGGGEMIEAPRQGEPVRRTSLRLGDAYGRP